MKGDQRVKQVCLTLGGYGIEGGKRTLYGEKALLSRKKKANKKEAPRSEEFSSCAKRLALTTSTTFGKKRNRGGLVSRDSGKCIEND